MSKVKLKELLVIRNGRDYKHLNEGDIPVFGSGGLMTYVDEYLADDESILLPRKGTLNNIMYVNGKFWTVDTLYWTEINKNKVYPKYLYLYLSSLDLSRKDSGSTLPSMTFDAYYSIDVELPELEVQKKIANFLFLLRDKIALNRKINDNLYNRLKLLYDYWFTQFDFPNKSNCPYAKSNGPLQWNEQLKFDIPVGWSVKKISDCTERIATGLNPRSNFCLGNGSIKYITVKNLTTNGSIDFDGCDTVDDAAKALIHRRSDIQIGDILFASIAPLGRCHLIQSEPYAWDINESVFSIRPDLKSVTAEYLYAFFVSDMFIKGATSSSTGSIFKGIRINTLQDTRILIPPMEIQKRFSEVAASLFKMNSLLASESVQLTELHNWLLPMLMNGQATLRD